MYIYIFSNYFIYLFLLLYTSFYYTTSLQINNERCTRCVSIQFQRLLVLHSIVAVFMIKYQPASQHRHTTSYSFLATDGSYSGHQRFSLMGRLIGQLGSPALHQLSSSLFCCRPVVQSSTVQYEVLCCCLGSDAANTLYLVLSRDHCP